MADHGRRMGTGADHRSTGQGHPPSGAAQDGHPDGGAVRKAPSRPVSSAARGLALLVSAILVPVLAGCGADETARADSRRTKEPSVPPAAPASIEKIAAMTGCRAEIRIEADELREGVCKTSLGNYVVTTFPREKLKLTWLEAASIYGGKYLVGPRWAIGARPDVLEKLRFKVGGEIKDVRQMDFPSPSASTPGENG